MQKLKVLTLNIHKGFSSGNNRFTLSQIREKLRASQTNLVFLQEVVGANEKHQRAVKDWPDQNQFEYLADSVWSHFAYGKNAIYQHGHHGNAILSEIPFSTTQNIDVSLLKFSQRGILHGVLETGVHTLCIHFGLFESERRQQIASLLQYVKKAIPNDAPVILAGDFNDWNRRSHRTLISQLGLTEAHLAARQKLAATFPSRLPMLTMDRIYVRGFTVEYASVLTGKDWHSLSDHCPLRADMHLQKEWSYHEPS